MQHKKTNITFKGVLAIATVKYYAFHGHGLSLLAHLRSLRGLRIRAETGTAHCSSHRKPWFPLESTYFTFTLCSFTNKMDKGLDRKSTRLNSSHVSISY